MSGLDEYLGYNASSIIRIKEETVDTVTLPQSGEFPEETFLTLAERFQFDDKRCLVGTCTSDEVVTLNLLTAQDCRIGSQNRVHLIDDLTCTGN